MTTLCLVNDAQIAPANFATLTRALSYYMPLVTKAWGIAEVTVTSGVPKATDWQIILTEKNRHAGASGYHNPSTIPMAYCSPRAAYRLFGTYHPPFVVKGRTINGERFLPGLITTICHEAAEMVLDPFVKTFSSLDSKARSWLVEICDPVMGSFLVYTDPITKVNCVLADLVTPSFYDVKGVAPYSLKHAVSAPFTMTKSGYAFYKSATGALVRVV